MKEKILVVDDDPNLRKTLADILKLKGYVAQVAASGAEAIAFTEHEIFSLALVDLRLPDMTGIEVITQIKVISPLTEAIILTGHASIDTAVDATRSGAFSYILKPYQIDDLLLTIRHGIDRRQARLEISRLSEALRQTQQAIFVANADLNFEYVNSAFTELFGYSIDDVAGQPISLLADSEPDPVHTLIVSAENRTFNGEVLRKTKQGKRVPVLLKVSPVVDDRDCVMSYVASITDLTELKSVEACLRESEEKFRSISASAQDAVIMLDENGAVNFWNAAAETIFGYASSEVLGQDLHTLLAPARYKQAFSKGFAAFRNSGQGNAVGKTLELAAIRKGGVEFPMEISLSSVRSQNKWLSIGIVRDISERKLAEACAKENLEELSRANLALTELNSKLEQAQSQLMQSEKMASIGMLAAGVAHEINNPIGYIHSNLETLEIYLQKFIAVLDAYERIELAAPELAERFADVKELRLREDFTYLKKDALALLSESHEGVDRVTKIVQNLKDFSRVDSTEQWAMDDIHHGLDSTLNVVWNELKYSCEVRKEYGVLPPVECMLSQLNQVFMNLLVNAAQAIETKGTITIRTGYAQNWVWIEISDTGRGILPKHINSIFDPFFTTKPVGKGTGLGLSVSYSIIQKHHGRIEVDSTPGKGTTFRVCLPIRQPANEAGGGQMPV